MGGQSVLYHRHGVVTLLHRTRKVGEVSGRRVSKAGGKRLFPGSGDLLMQITKKGSFLGSGLEFGPLRNRSSSFDARDSRGSSGQSSASFSASHIACGFLLNCCTNYVCTCSIFINAQVVTTWLVCQVTI